jgi:putative IMPACT (imprinted ancient) family translation regulator
MMAALLRSNKVARATHNMLAYRFTTPAGSLVQDFDDDGEAAAGGRLLHLLQVRVFLYLPRALVLRCSLAIALTAVTAY